MEMYQMMLQYKEVYTNMVFENIPTMPLELRAGIERTVSKKKMIMKKNLMRTSMMMDLEIVHTMALSVILLEKKWKSAMIAK